MKPNYETRHRMKQLEYLRATGKMSDEELEIFIRCINGDDQQVKPVKEPTPERIVTPDMLRAIRTQYIMTLQEGVQAFLDTIDVHNHFGPKGNYVNELKTGYFRETLEVDMRWAHILTRDELHAHSIKITSAEFMSDDNSVVKLTVEWQVEKTMPEAEFISGMNKWLIENKTMYDFDHTFVGDIKPIT